MGERVYDRHIAYPHLRTFRDVYCLLEQIVDATPESARAMLRRLRHGVSSRNAAIAGAIASQPEVLTLEQFLAGPTLLPAPQPTPRVTTTGELKGALGEYVYTEFRSRPIDCPGCWCNYHGPIPSPVV